MTAGQTPRSRSRSRAGACVAAGLALALGPTAALPSAAGSSVTTSATVEILRPAGVIGLQELSNAQGFLASPDSAAAAEGGAPLAAGPIAPPPSGGALAAAIAISGAPNQTFSLVVTDTLVVVTETGELVVTSFDHNAGDNPTIGGDGAARIAIGATTQSGSPETLQQLSTNAGGGGADGAAQAPSIVAVTVQTAEGPQTVRIQRPDAFGPTIFGEKFFTVLVSYN